MRVEVCIYTACLTSFDKLDSLHDLVRKRNLGKPNLLCDIAYFELILRTSKGVH
jgi:hypothetical protein